MRSTTKADRAAQGFGRSRQIRCRSRCPRSESRWTTGLRRLGASIIARPVGDCCAANRKMPVGSRRITNLTQPLHRLQTPSNRIRALALRSASLGSHTNGARLKATHRPLSMPERLLATLSRATALNVGLQPRLGHSLLRWQSDLRTGMNTFRATREGCSKCWKERTLRDERQPTLRLCDRAPAPELLAARALMR